MTRLASIFIDYFLALPAQIIAILGMNVVWLEPEEGSIRFGILSWIGATVFGYEQGLKHHYRRGQVEYFWSVYAIPYLLSIISFVFSIFVYYGWF